MGDTATASAPVTVNTAEKPIEEQREELVGKITDLAKDPVNNSAELAQLAMKYADLEKLDIAQKAEVKKEEETIQAEQTQEHKEETDQATQQANQEKAMKMEDLINKLQDKPENAEKNAEELVEQSKTRIKQTIDRYTSKIKELNTANETEKANITKELESIRADLKKEKNTYEKVKKDFFAPSGYNFEKFTKEDLKKASTKMIRYSIREGKLFNSPRLTKMATIRRNITIKTLIKKFNKIGTEEKKGVRFIMGFEKTRFLRYTGIKTNSIIDQAGSAMGMQINPQQFHTSFNEGRKNIFAILDADTGDKLESGEVEIIKAIKARINYYGYTYARERANAWVSPFIDAEKNAKEGEQILDKQEKSKLDMTEDQKKELLKVNSN